MKPSAIQDSGSASGSSSSSGSSSFRSISTTRSTASSWASSESSEITPTTGRKRSLDSSGPTDKKGTKSNFRKNSDGSTDKKGTKSNLRKNSDGSTDKKGTKLNLRKNSGGSTDKKGTKSSLRKSSVGSRYTDKKGTKSNLRQMKLQKFRSVLNSRFPRMLPVTKRMIPEEEKNEINWHWSGEFDYRLFCTSMLVGLGNLIVFPILFHKHGALAFSLVYVLVVSVIGYPSILMHAGLGQFCSRGIGGIWEFATLFKGVGYVAIIWVLFDLYEYFSNILLSSVVISKIIMHDEYFDAFRNHHFSAVPQLFGSIIKNLTTTTTTTDISNTTTMLDIPPDAESGDSILLLQEPRGIICFVINGIFVTCFLLPEIRIRGSIGSKLFTFVAVSTCVILIRSIALDGAENGILFAFDNNSLAGLLDYKIYVDACFVCIKSLNLNPAYHTTFSSYNDFNNHIPSDILFIVLVDCSFFFLGVVMLFSLLGHAAETTNFKLENIQKYSGKYLMFIEVPSTLSNLEYGKAWLIFYFIFAIVVFHLNMTIAFEVVIRACIDILNLTSKTRKMIVVWSSGCILIFLTILYLLIPIDVIDTYTKDSDSSIVCGMLAFAIAWVFGVDHFISLIECSVGWCTTPVLSNPWFKLWWKICWKYVMPATYLVLHIYHFTQKDIQLIRWHIIMESVTIFGTMVFLLATTKGELMSRLEYLTNPTAKWGPVLPQNRFIMQIGKEDERREEEFNLRPSKELPTTYEELIFNSMNFRRW